MPIQGNVIPTQPQTEVILCSGIEWDNSYKHCRLFNSVDDLYSHVLSKCPTPGEPYHITQATPISTGKMRVKIPEADTKMMGLNYLAFNNRGIADRWFFCFITGMDWLSDNSCVLEFEYDIFQNCAYRTDWKACYIEQSHIPKSQDVLYSNLFPVNIETGEPICVSREHVDFGDWNICFYATQGTTGSALPGQVSQNVYRGCQLWSCKASEYEKANELIDAYTTAGKVDALLTCFMSPDLCLNSLTGTSQTITVVDAPANLFEGYKPKNNKLYSYPWIYVIADNNEGKTTTYKFEYSSNTTANRLRFQSFGVINTMPAIYSVPLDYKGTATNNLEAMENTGFPVCAWSSDSFQAWIAQNKSALALGAVSSVGSIVGGAGLAAATGGLTAVAGGGLAGSGISGIANQIATISDKEREPAVAHGKVVSENINAALGLSRVDYYVMSSKAEFAKIADDYFTMFGYPIRAVQSPNITSRSNWNYIKTVDCGFSGDYPPDMMKPFRDIFDNGVTIWHTNDIGNYGLDNN